MPSPAPSTCCPPCVALAGGKVPAEPVIDGRDISPLLLGKTTQSPREAHYYFAVTTCRRRQGPWKLAIATQPETMGKSSGDDAKINPRLYNLDTEIGEQTNLADKHPDIVAKLTSLADKMNAEIGGKEPKARRPAGEVENPVTLYPTSEAPRGKKKDVPKKAKGKPVALEALKPGDTLGSDDAPQIAQTGFTLSCTVETSQPDAILIAHGGLSAGYALHLRGGHLVFMVRTGGGDAFDEIQSPNTITGPTRIVASLAKDRTMTLTVNDQVVATGKARSLIARQPQEDFCIGHDNMKPVAAYAGKEKFEGSITALKITTP
jgi:arylsulfatase A